MVVAAKAVERAFRVAALIWAPAWLLNIALALAGHTVVSRAPSLAIVCIGGAVLAWLLLSRTRITSRTFVTVLWVSSCAQIALADVRHLSGNYLYLTGLINSVVVLAGLLLAARGARTSAMALVALTLTWLTWHAVHTGLMDVLWRQLLIAGYYAVVDVMVVSYATSVLRRAARDADTQALTNDEFLSASTRRRAVLLEHQRIMSLLHDTLINTLGAIRRGVTASTAEQVRARCRMDLERVRGFVEHSNAGDAVTPAALTAETVARADALGLQAQIECDATLEIPTDVATAVLGALTELLLNVSKHTGDSRVDVTFGVNESARELEVSVRDFGPGWDGRGQLRGFALSVHERLQSVQGRYTVSALPDSGTQVTLHIPLTPVPQVSRPTSTPLAALMPVALRKLTLICGMWWVSLGAVQTALAWGSQAFSGSFVALTVLIAALVTAGWWARRQGALSATAAWVLMVPLAAVTALPQLGIPGCAMTEPGAWGPDGAVGIIMAIVLMGRSWQPVLACSAGLVVGLLGPLFFSTARHGDCPGASMTTLLIEIGTVFALHLFRSKAEGLISQSHQAQEEAAAADAEEAVAEYRQQTFSTRLALLSGPTGRLFANIATGTADPTATDIRRAAGALEQALRAVTALDPELGAFGDMLTDFIMDAAGRGVQVRIVAADAISSPSPEVVHELRAMLDSLVANRTDSDGVTMTITALDDAASLSVVVSENPSAPFPHPRSSDSSGVTVTSEHLEQEILVTATWSAT